MDKFSPESVVWVKVTGGKWWPGQVIAKDNCPDEVKKRIKENTVAVVKYFDEDFFEVVKSESNIYPFDCKRRKEFLKRGKESTKGNTELDTKFESDVSKASALCPGIDHQDKNIPVDESLSKENKKRLMEDLFPSAKKKKKKVSEENTPKSSKSAGNTPKSSKKNKSTPNSKNEVEYDSSIVRIREQTSTPLTRSTGCYTCYICGFQTTRVDNIVFHNRTHSDAVKFNLSKNRYHSDSKQRSITELPKDAHIKVKKKLVGSPVLSAKKKLKLNKMLKAEAEVTAIAQSFDDFEDEEDSSSQKMDDTTFDQMEADEAKTAQRLEEENRAGKIQDDDTNEDRVEDSDIDSVGDDSNDSQSQANMNDAFDALLGIEKKKINIDVADETSGHGIFPDDKDNVNVFPSNDDEDSEQEESNNVFVSRDVRGMEEELKRTDCSNAEDSRMDDSDLCEQFSSEEIGFVAEKKINSEENRSDLAQHESSGNSVNSRNDSEIRDQDEVVEHQQWVQAEDELEKQIDEVINESDSVLQQQQQLIQGQNQPDIQMVEIYDSENLTENQHWVQEEQNLELETIPTENQSMEQEMLCYEVVIAANDHKDGEGGTSPQETLIRLRVPASAAQAGEGALESVNIILASSEQQYQEGVTSMQIPLNAASRMMLPEALQMVMQAAASGGLSVAHSETHNNYVDSENR